MYCVYNEKIIKPSVEKKCVRCSNPRMIDSRRAAKQEKRKIRNRRRLTQKSKAHYTLMKLTKLKSYIMNVKC